MLTKKYLYIIYSSAKYILAYSDHSTPPYRLKHNSAELKQSGLIIFCRGESHKIRGGLQDQSLIVVVSQGQWSQLASIGESGTVSCSQIFKTSRAIVSLFVLISTCGTCCIAACRQRIEPGPVELSFVYLPHRRLVDPTVSTWLHLMIWLKLPPAFRIW